MLPPAKRKCDLFRQVAFSFGFRSRWSLHPSVIEMLGRSEFALRQGFACGKTLVRRKGAAGQKAVWMLLKKNCKRPERIWIVTPCHKNNHTERCGYFYGYREDFTCPAEVNSACTKVLALGQNTCTAQKRRGPEGRFSEMLYLFRMHMPKSRLSAAAESLLFV